MRLAALLGSLLDRILLLTRRRGGPSRAWDEPSEWTSDWTTPERGVPRPAVDLDAEDVVAHGAPTGGGKHVQVEQVPEDPDEPTVDGVIEDDAAGTGGDPADGTDETVDAYDVTETPDAVADTGDGTGGAGGGGGGNGGNGGNGNGNGNGDDPVPPVPAQTSWWARRDVRAGIALVAATATLAGMSTAPRVWPFRDPLDEQAVRATTGRFAAAWVRDDLAGSSFDQQEPTAKARKAFAAKVADRAQRITAGLTASDRDVPEKVELVGDPVLDAPSPDGGRTARQDVRVTWDLDGAPWVYTTTVALRRRNDQWRVVWSPSMLHRQVTDDGGLVTERVSEPRADIVGADGALMRTRTAYQVTYRTRAKGYFLPPYTTARKLSEATGVDRTWLMGAIRTAKPGSTITVTTLRSISPARMDRIRDVEGAEVRKVTRPLAPTTTFARSLLGEAMPATKEMSAASRGAYLPGDIVGVTGLQRQYDRRLRGTPQPRVVVEPLGRTALQPVTVTAQRAQDGTLTVPASKGTPVDEPVKASSQPPQPVRLTLDTDVQLAAQRAVDRRGKRTVLVAIDITSGDVLAVASNVDEEWDRGLLGTYPPGSTFKIVTTYALTGNGADASTRLPCPASVTVGGNPFRNVDRAPGGTRPLARQFALSCNTAFAGLGGRVSDAQLRSAASDLGLLGDVAGLGLTAYPGAVPEHTDAASHAAALIGQSTVTVSPLNVATATASVASGVRRPPHLLVDPEPATDAPAAETALDQRRAATMRSLMCEAVRTGTAKALRAAPGGPVSGKTGTAQQDDDTPFPQPHGWFTGYQGKIAFAVVVERGGLGARSAVPVALDFLRELNKGQKARPAKSCGAASAA